MSKWVGESEKAVREIFRKAKQVAPAIIFFDELDAIAPRRGWGGDARVTERVVNQILTSMDGLENMEGVTVIGATNRPDIIDPGLLRAGRFDRIMLVPAPGNKARVEILKVHTKNMPLATDVDLEVLANKTEGYTGADLAGLCREAGMLAMREHINTREVTMQHFERAMEVIRPTITEETKRYYESMKKQLEGRIERAAREELAAYR
jgi:transitional endoplasmic reticulum ATPase